MKKIFGPVIALKPTSEEMVMVEAIRREFKRRSKSDVIRFLISEAYEKILQKTIPNGVKKED